MANSKLSINRPKFREMSFEARRKAQADAFDACEKAIECEDWKEVAWQIVLICLAENPDGDPIQMLIENGVITQEEIDEVRRSRFDADSFADQMRQLLLRNVIVLFVRKLLGC